MKKILAALALLAASTAVSAVDFGLQLNRDYGYKDFNRNGFGATIGQKFGKLGVEGGFERFANGQDQDRWSLLAGYDVVTFGKALPTTLVVKGGAAYLNNQYAKDGMAWLLGTGLNIPLSKQFAVTVDYRYQWGQSRVSSYDGSTLGAGLKYSF